MNTVTFRKVVNLQEFKKFTSAVMPLVLIDEQTKLVDADHLVESTSPEMFKDLLNWGNEFAEVLTTWALYEKSKRSAVRNFSAQVSELGQNQLLACATVLLAFGDYVGRNQCRAEVKKFKPKSLVMSAMFLVTVAFRGDTGKAEEWSEVQTIPTENYGSWA